VGRKAQWCIPRPIVKRAMGSISTPLSISQVILSMLIAKSWRHKKKRSWLTRMWKPYVAIASGEEVTQPQRKETERTFFKKHVRW